MRRQSLAVPVERIAARADMRMLTSLRWSLMGIAVLVGFALYVDLPTGDGLKLPEFNSSRVVSPTSLTGWRRLVYCAKPANGTYPTATVMKETLETIQKRLAGGSFGEPSIQVRGHCITIYVRDVKNPRVLNGIASRGLLVLGDSGVKSPAADPLMPDERVRLTRTGVGDMTTKPPDVKIVVPGSDVVRGSASLNSNPTTGSPEVNYLLNSVGANLWCSYTSSHVDYYSPVVLNETVVVSPVIQQSICGGQTQVTGLSRAGANALVIDLNYGALPITLHLVSTKLVAGAPPASSSAIGRNLVALTVILAGGFVLLAIGIISVKRRRGEAG